jgi:hypothetical protein
VSDSLLKSKLSLQYKPRPSAASFQLDRDKPCVFKDSIDNELARTLNFENLKQRFPDKQIKLKRSLCKNKEHISSGLHQYADYITKGEPLINVMVEHPSSGDTTFSDFTKEDRLYCLALNCEYVEDFIDHVSCPSFFGDWFDKHLPTFRDAVVHGHMHTWFFIGPKGTLSELHSDHDDIHTTIQQCCGVKRFFTILPEQQIFLEDKFGDHLLESLRFSLEGEAIRVTSQTDSPEERSLVGAMESIDVYVNDIQAGDVIYIPSMTGHYAESLTNSISVSRDFIDDRNIDAYLFSGLFKSDLFSRACQQAHFGTINALINRQYETT